MKKHLTPGRMAVALGFVLWLLLCLLSGRAEAWDSGLYFTLGMGGWAVAAGALGYYYPKRAWRWGFYMALGQFCGLALTGLWAGHGLGLLPLGVVAMVIYNLPYCLSGMLGALARRAVPRGKVDD